MSELVECPLCLRMTSTDLEDDPKLSTHTGEDYRASLNRWAVCRASRRTQATARLMRANLDAGRKPWRNEDGTAVPGAI